MIFPIEKALALPFAITVATFLEKEDLLALKEIAQNVQKLVKNIFHKLAASWGEPKKLFCFARAFLCFEKKKFARFYGVFSLKEVQCHHYRQIALAMELKIAKEGFGDKRYLKRKVLVKNEAPPIVYQKMDGELIEQKMILNLTYRALFYLPGILSQIKIRNLSCMCNYLTEIPPHFGKMESLRLLNLSGNYLHSLPQSFGKLRISHLDLDENFFEEVPIEIAGISTLKTLSMNRNRVETFPCFLTKLKNLKKLSLEENHIKHIEAFKRPKNLQIFLKKNPIRLSAGKEPFLTDLEKPKEEKNPKKSEKNL